MPESISKIFIFLGNPMIALGLGVLVSWWVLKKHFPPKATPIKKGIEDAAPIVFLTGAGGAFGYMVSQSDMIGETLAAMQFHANMMELLLIGFILNAILKTLQGSSTAALIISSSFLFPFVDKEFLENGLFMCHLIGAMGFGAMVISHTNDSYFWVVNQISDLEVKRSLTSFSLYTLVLGLCGILIVLLSALLIL